MGEHVSQTKKSERQGEEEIHYRAYTLVDTEGKRKK